jgi:hypothetical protein
MTAIASQPRWFLLFGGRGRGGDGMITILLMLLLADTVGPAMMVVRCWTTKRTIPAVAQSIICQNEFSHHNIIPHDKGLQQAPRPTQKQEREGAVAAAAAAWKRRHGRPFRRGQKRFVLFVLIDQLTLP